MRYAWKDNLEYSILIDAGGNDRLQFECTALYLRGLSDCGHSLIVIPTQFVLNANQTSFRIEVFWDMIAFGIQSHRDLIRHSRGTLIN